MERTVKMSSIDAVILNWERATYLKHVVAKLVKHPYINNVIISHGKKETYFGPECFGEYSHRVICLDHSEINPVIGLSRRFICKEYITTSAVLIMDDDLVFTDRHITDLVNHYFSHPNAITSYYGRTLIKFNNQIIYYFISPTIFRNPYIHNIFVSVILHIYIYFYIWFYHIKPNIALTRILIAPIKSLDIFTENAKCIEPFIKAKSTPLWNGEDIFFSLAYAMHTGRSCKIYSPYIPILDTYESLFSGISNNAGHLLYRYECCKEIARALNIQFDSYGIPVFPLSDRIIDYHY